MTRCFALFIGPESRAIAKGPSFLYDFDPQKPTVRKKETDMGNDITNDAVAEEAAENFARHAETMGGRVRLNWDERVEMSTNAHHVLFSEFLAVSGLFDRFVEEAPLVYTSNNAPAKRDVLGTAVLGIVDGAKRFRHFDSLTGDGVSAETFGLSKTMSCDSVRRGSSGWTRRQVSPGRSGRTSGASRRSCRRSASSTSTRR